MEIIRAQIHSLLTDPSNKNEDYLNDYKFHDRGRIEIFGRRPDADRTVYSTEVTLNNGWIDFGSGVVSRFSGTARPMSSFRSLINISNLDRPLARFVETENQALLLTTRFPAHVYSHRFFLENLVDLRNAQCIDVPKLLEMGQKLGVNFTFGPHPLLGNEK